MKAQANDALIRQLDYLVKAHPRKILLQPWQVSLLRGRFTFKDDLPHYADIPVEVIRHG